MTDFRGYIQSASVDMPKRMKRTPKPIASSAPQASATQAQAVRQATAARSHNVFRPDIYRVSEGYLN